MVVSQTCHFLLYLHKPCCPGNLRCARCLVSNSCFDHGVADSTGRPRLVIEKLQELWRHGEEHDLVIQSELVLVQEDREPLWTKNLKGHAHVGLV